jgi:hypothetical protein
MSIFICGSASGIEPIKGRHHSAWILETENKLYQFDAGENCICQAYLNVFFHVGCRSSIVQMPLMFFRYYLQPVVIGHSGYNG